MNKQVKIIRLLTLFFLLICLPGTVAADQILSVLVYHHIQENVQSDVSCTPSQFREQMLALKDAGFTPLNLQQTRLFLAGALPEIEKPVLITFDDGYESLFHFALPVAVEHKIPMTVFVITSRIGLKPQFSRYLHESQIKEMVDSGFFDFGSHTHDLHTDSIRIFDAFAGAEDNPVLVLLQRDLRISSARLASITGKRPIAIAWPYGKFNSAFTSLARKSGFKLHFTSIHGYNEPGANPYVIKRVPVTSRDTAETVVKKASGSRR